MFVAIGQGFSGLSFLLFGYSPELSDCLYAEKETLSGELSYIYEFILVSFGDSSFVLGLLKNERG